MLSRGLSRLHMHNASRRKALIRRGAFLPSTGSKKSTAFRANAIYIYVPDTILFIRTMVLQFCFENNENTRFKRKAHVGGWGDVLAQDVHGHMLTFYLLHNTS